MFLLRILPLTGCIFLFVAGYSARAYTEGQKLYLSTKIHEDISDKWIDIQTIQHDRHGLYITKNDVVWIKNTCLEE